MKYRIEEKPAFRIVGSKLTTTMKNQECFAQIPTFREKCTQNGTVAELASIMGIESPLGILGISVIKPTHAPFEFDYYFAVATNHETIKDTEEYMIPAATWAIFECIGALPQALQSLSVQIMTQWLPASGYLMSSEPSLEVYMDNDMSKPDARSELWMPVKKKLQH